MSTLQATMLLEDSLRVRYSVRQPDGVLLPLTSFTGSLVIKASPSIAAPAIVTVAGVLQSGDLEFLFVVPPDTIVTAGTLYATVRAFDLTESYSETFTIRSLDHA